MPKIPRVRDYWSLSAKERSIVAKNLKEFRQRLRSHWPYISVHDRNFIAMHALVRFCAIAYATRSAHGEPILRRLKEIVNDHN